MSSSQGLRDLDPKEESAWKPDLGGRFGYFLFFSAPGRGRESGATGRGGGRFLIENPRRGGGLQERVGRGEGAGEGVCREFGGGGLNIFFRGRNAHQETLFCFLCFARHAHSETVCEGTLGKAQLKRVHSLECSCRGPFGGLSPLKPNTAVRMIGGSTQKPTSHTESSKGDKRGFYKPIFCILLPCLFYTHILGLVALKGKVFLNELPRKLMMELTSKI